MYQEHFRLSAMPFSIAPDPRFLHMSARYREAIAHLLFGVNGEGGFVLLTGEIGTGKTTLCRCLLEQIPEQCDIAYILNPRQAAGELLASLADEFHIALPPGSFGIKQQVDAINAYLLQANAAGRRAVVIIDEAQNLQPEVLEQLRLLTNLETNTRKLLQIILIGQPELQDLLQRPEMRQVAQRIVARFHLRQLSGGSEVAAYVKHRLRISGTAQALFPEALFGRLYKLSGGVPRLINLLCDRALLGTYVQGQQQVSRATLEQAAREVFGETGRPSRWRRLGWQLSCLGLAGAACIGIGLAYPAWLPAPPGNAPLVQAAHPPGPQVAGAAATAVILAGPEAAIAKPPPPAAPLAALGRALWPDNIAPRASSEKLAFRDLYRLYGINFDAQGTTPPCQVPGMRCQAGRGGLADLRAFNQPAVLVLDGNGRERQYHALLTGLDGETAELMLGGQKQLIRLPDLAPLWSGSYVLVWQAPPGFRELLSPGQRGPAIRWLRHGLGVLSGTPNNDSEHDDPSLFDQTLFSQLKAFQQTEGILPDGVAGAQTLIRLNMRLHKDLPQLGRNTAASPHVLHP
jgi:general secretion pathway protein A